MDWRNALHDTEWTHTTRKAYAWQLLAFEGWLGGTPPTTGHMEAWLRSRSDTGVSEPQLRQAHRALTWLAALRGLRRPQRPDPSHVEPTLWEAVAWRLHTDHGLSPAQLSRLRVAHVDGELLRYGRRPVRLSGRLTVGLGEVTRGRALSAPLFSDGQGRPLSARRLGQHLRKVARGSDVRPRTP
jgi:hypothetical protein